MMIAYPIWIAPLFNQIGPMKDKQLEKTILDLASRAGIQDGRVFEVDKSKDTTKGNAYVAGIGSTKQIVIWDTAIESNSQEELLFLMGHEMGHYVLNHTWQSLGYSSVLIFVIFYLVYRTANFLLSRYQKRFGFQHLYDIASLPLLLLLINFFFFLTTPISNYVSCYDEHEADRFGLEITRDNQAAAQLFADAVVNNLINPRPGIIYKIWRSDHPALGDRIDFCNTYCPWETGQPLKYGKYFNAD
jgi:Zn-dependent protease with chaperone function